MNDSPRLRDTSIVPLRESQELVYKPTAMNRLLGWTGSVASASAFQSSLIINYVSKRATNGRKNMRTDQHPSSSKSCR